jgi:hypothetical protein
MIKLIKIFIFLMIFTFFNTSLSAEEKTDCSMYSTKTVMGVVDKLRCKKGMEPREKLVIKNFGDLNPFKKKKKIKQENDEEILKTKVSDCAKKNTKTLVGLFNVMKCKKK